MTSMDKIVFSSTLQAPLTWANTRLVADDPVETVRGLKQGRGPSLRTIGSLTLCRSLLVAGLVDRFRVVVFPVVTGASGREHFYSGWPDVALETVDHRTFDDRLQMMEFVPTVLDGPPPMTAGSLITAGSPATRTRRGSTPPGAAASAN